MQAWNQKTIFWGRWADGQMIFIACLLEANFLKAIKTVETPHV